MPQQQSDIRQKTRYKKPRMYKVTMHNDNITTMEFVIKVLIEIFHRTPDDAEQLMLKIPLSDRNFSMYKDTLLLSEDLSPRVYTVNRDGKLTPRYKIDFTTNTYHQSFEDGELDIDRMQREEREGNLTKMSNGFYENDRYVIKLLK